MNDYAIIMKAVQKLLEVYGEEAVREWAGFGKKPDELAHTEPEDMAA